MGSYRALAGPRWQDSVGAAVFGCGWVFCSAASGALLGGLAVALSTVFPMSGLILWFWGSSGFGVGATQWLLIRRWLDVSFRFWVFATGCGAFLSLCIHFYLGSLFFKTGGSLPYLISKHGYDLLLPSVVAVVAGGLALGVPQLVALRYTDIRLRAWLLAALFGFLALWLWSLGLWSMLMELVGISERHWPRPVRIIRNFAGYWVAVSFAQAFVIAPAVKRRMRATLISPE
jgi:hypothetical protein